MEETRELPPSELEPNPANPDFAADAEREPIEADEEGVFRENPKVTPESHFTRADWTIISGHRRIESAKEREWDVVKVDVVGPYESEDAERRAVLEHNDYRRMTKGEQVNVAYEYLKLWHGEPVENLPQDRDTRDRLDRLFKTSGKSLESGLKVKWAAEKGEWEGEQIPPDVHEVAQEQWSDLLAGDVGFSPAHNSIKAELDRQERAQRRQQYEEREDVDLSLVTEVETKPLPEPVRPFIWPGNKAKYSDWIISLMPEHETYVEPFAGAAGILFNKPPSLVEVLNDYDPDVATFYEVLRDDRERLGTAVQAIPYTEDSHEYWRERWHNGKPVEDRILQSTVFLFLRHAQYLGKVPSPSSFDESNASSYYDRQLSLPDLQKRLTRDDPDYFHERFIESVENAVGFPSQRKVAINAGTPVEIRNTDFEDVLTEFDGEDTLAYVDPPYRGGEQQYPSDFGPEDLERLIETLNDFEGDWMLSYGEEPPASLDTEYVEPPKEVNQGIGADSGATREEWLITNVHEDRIGTFKVALLAGDGMESDW